MSSTITTTTSYGQRLGNSLKGVIFGIILIIGSIGLLWWNEGNSVKVATGLDEGQKITVAGKINPIDTMLEGKLIHVHGKADTQNTISDDVFGISIKAIKLLRVVEMYQWQEHQKSETHDNIGGSETTTTTYTYEKVWSDDELDSSSYYETNRSNPSHWKYTSSTIVNDDISIGDLQLSSSFVNAMNDKKLLNLSGRTITISDQNTHNLSDMIYVGKNPNNPEIGDMRIKFYAVYPDKVSVIGQQNANTLVSYVTKTNTNIALLEYGVKSIQEMYQKAHDNNTQMTWIVRGAGMFLMYLGFTMIFGIIVTLSKVLPFLGDIVGLGTSLIALILTLSIGGTTIALAWIVARPLMGIIILLIVCGSIVGLAQFKKTHKDTNEPQITS